MKGIAINIATPIQKSLASNGMSTISLELYHKHREKDAKMTKDFQA